ncbi:MAG: rhodanese-like domain-containing protein [Hyphomicrobiaceae bacterium]|nr:rhodanese-like domain-containing protein [Hyphomicrobiaceae bacterium]
MARTIDARAVKKALSEPSEIALLDVRETGAYSQGHPFHVVPLAYSRLELDAERLLPRKGVRMVLVDGGDGIAEKAARRLEALGYTDVSVLAGGAPGWKAAGYTLFEGVNVPSKAFGEVVEIARHTPRITARQLVDMQKRGENMVIVDGRTWDEYRRFNIPGGTSLPNGELVLHIDGLVKDPKTKIVVNCAGRTRSIIGAQTLIDWGIDNEVVALENGTQGYWLEGIPIEHGADRRAPKGDMSAAALAAKRKRARAHAERHGVRFVNATDAVALGGNAARTTYLLDVRTAEEFARDALPAFVHAPGGQLQQATDQWVGVKGAQLILTDMGEMVRAPFVAAWLRQLGHEAMVLTDGAKAHQTLEQSGLAAFRKPGFDASRIRQKEVSPEEVAALLASGQGQVIDLRPSMSHRDECIPGSVWSIRPYVAKVLRDASQPVALVADDPRIAALATLDLAEAGAGDIAVLRGGIAAWKGESRPVAPSSGAPADAECIDFVWHTLGRNEGNLDAARAYLAWEINLVDQLDEQERASFRL